MESTVRTTTTLQPAASIQACGHFATKRHTVDLGDCLNRCSSTVRRSFDRQGMHMKLIWKAEQCLEELTRVKFTVTTSTRLLIKKKRFIFKLNVFLSSRHGRSRFAKSVGFKYCWGARLPLPHTCPCHLPIAWMSDAETFILNGVHHHRLHLHRLPVVWSGISAIEADRGVASTFAGATANNCMQLPDIAKPRRHTGCLQRNTL